MCIHKECELENRIWIPIRIDETSDIIPHPWCIHCGLVKNMSDDCPNNINYWLNKLTLIAKHFNLKQVQKRLISKELIAHEWFNDLYGISGSNQKKIFIMIVKKYSNICEKSIDFFFIVATENTAWSETK
jgi:hypothetical protein